MKNYKIQTLLAIAALLSRGNAFASEARSNLPALSKNLCVQYELPLPVVLDDGTDTGRVVLPVLDENRALVTSVSPEEAQTSKLSACTSVAPKTPPLSAQMTQTVGSYRSSVASEATLR